jgi:hypothetical protein
MVLPNQPLPWQFNSNHVYVPITYDNEVVGFCKPEYAPQITEVMNDEQKVRRALKLACAALSKQSNGQLGTTDALVEEYLERAAVPRSGTRAIALLLKNRQEELGVTEKEFIRFCDSYRLSPEKLQEIYGGDAKIESTLLAPLARILGQSLEEVVQIIEG